MLLGKYNLATYVVNVLMAGFKWMVCSVERFEWEKSYAEKLIGFVLYELLLVGKLLLLIIEL